MMKRMLALGLAVLLLLSGSVLVPGQASAQVNKTFGQPEDLGTAVTSVATLDTAYGIEDGRQVIYTTASGSPGVFQVIGLEPYELLRSFPLEGVHGSWSHVVDGNGNVYIAGSGKVFRYSPDTKTVRDYGVVVPGAREVYGLSVDEEGYVYGGTYPDSKVFRLDPVSGAIYSYGTIVEGQDYVRSLAYYEGFLYAGIGIKGSLVRINAATGEKQDVPLPDRPSYYDINNLGSIFGLNVVRNYLFVMVSGSNVLLVYDMESESWLPHTITNYRGLYTSPEHEGKTYFTANQKLQSFHLDTHEVVETGITFGTYLRHSGWVTVDDPALPGLNLVTIQYGGQVTLFNIGTGALQTWLPVVQGQPTPIQTIEKGPDGMLYLSGYMGTFGSQFNPVTGEKLLFNLGQAEGMVEMNGKMYFGTYPGALVYEFDPAQPAVQGENPRLLFDIGEEQDRPFAMTTGDDKLFLGTISDYGQLGGALTVYDGQQAQTYRHVVQDQSIIGLAYRDGLIYGSTTVWGGLGIDPAATQAKMFVWDVEAGEKIAEFTPAIPQSGPAAKAIGSLSFGPDGLLWGIAYGTIFAMNPDTYEIVKSKEVEATDWNFSHFWRPKPLRWGQDGLIYATLGAHITVVDPETLEHVTLQNSGLMTLGDDGHIYYADGANVKKIEVTDGAPPVMKDFPVALDNASFEEPMVGTDIPGWSPLFGGMTPNATYEVSLEQAYSGEASLKLKDTSTTETVAVTTGKLDVTPGTEYTATTQLYLESGRSIFVLRFYDENDRELGTKAAYVTTGHGSWQKVTVSEFAPEGAAYARVFALCTQYWMTTAFYDDVTFSYKGLVPAPEVDVVSPSAAWVTNDPTPAIVVRAAEGDVIQVWDGETEVGRGVGAGGADVSLELDALAEGVHELKVTATDADGRRGKAAALPPITVDLTAPEAPTVLNPERPTSTNDAQVAIVFQAEAGATLTVMNGELVVGQGRVAPDESQATITLEGLEQGIHKLTVFASDQAGNTSEIVAMPHIIINNGLGPK